MRIFDFDSTVPDYANPTGLPHDFGFVYSDDSNTDWWLNVQALMAPNLIEYTTSGSGSYTTTGFARRILNADVEITVETQFTWERNIDYYHNLCELRNRVLQFVGENRRRLQRRRHC